jgi:hypothetical protein
LAKLTLADGTIIEGTPQELYDITQKFGVKSDEPSKEITHNGVAYTLVDRKAQTGDVVILSDTGGDCFDIGKTYEVLEGVQIADRDGDIFDLYRQALRRTTETVLVYEPKAETLKVGDYAVIEGYSLKYDGTIVELTKKWAMDGVRFDVIFFGDSPIRSMGVKNLRKATDAEVAEAKVSAERNAVFTQAGRKPNEYRKGDIVRVTRDNVLCSVNMSGDIGEVTEVVSYGFTVYVKSRGDSANRHGSDSVEPIVFAESRLDLRK